MSNDPLSHQNWDERQSILAAIIESSDDAIISKTLHGFITSWNKAAERMFGYTEAEALGQHISILIPAERLSEENLIIGSISRGEKVDHFETVRKAKDGRLIPISLTVSPIKDGQGMIIGASKIARDNTEKLTADERMKRSAEELSLLNAVGKAISEDLDTQGILQKVTDASTRLCGANFGAFFYNTVDENGEAFMLYTLSGAPREAFEKFGMPRNTQVFHATFSGQGVVRSGDITKDPRYGKNPPHAGMPAGHLPVVSYLAAPVISKSGTVIGGLFLGHAEPDRFTASHEILLESVASQAAVALDNAQLLSQVQVLNTKKDEFIGLASHELKTPVTSIKGYLQLLSKDPDIVGKNRFFVEKALDQTRKMTGLITDLLNVSTIEAGKVVLSKSVFDLNVLAAEVAENLGHESEAHPISLSLAPGELNVDADRNRIEQVMINLVGNAIKYSPKGGQISIDTRQADDQVEFSVTDKGIGISQTDAKSIFSRFYRVDNASHISGLGIGLYLAQDIVNRHDGVIWLDSEPGNGSTFRFRLPAGKPG